MGRTKELLETLNNEAAYEFINNKFFFETLESYEKHDNRVLE